jgi:hypothetical protein
MGAAAVGRHNELEQMNPAKPCSVCGEACKTVGACRSLRLPPDGFYTGGGGGGGGHSHDDDESILIATQRSAQTYSQDDEVPPTRPTQVSVLHMIPNTLSNVAV